MEGTGLTPPAPSVRSVPRVLSIAGTDPTGGAGVPADLKSIAASGGYGLAVVTSLVAQNTRGVRSVHTPPVEFLREQLEAVSDDVRIDAVKVGMLGDVHVIAEVAAWLRRTGPGVVVIDPVMVATSGDRLLPPDAEEALRSILPLAGLVTPNVPELAVLAGTAPATTPGEMVEQARAVSRGLGVRVLAKGGHLPGDPVADALVDGDTGRTVHWFRSTRVPTTATHGTGCSLSSSIATWQFVTGDWAQSVDRARRWLTESLRHGESLNVGRGNGPVSHFAGLWARGGLETSATAEWWERIADLRRATDTDPFLAGLAAGTLEKESFAQYLSQDEHYLEGYARALSGLARQADDPVEQAFWARSAAACLTTETALHRAWTPGTRPAVGETTRHYLDHLNSAVEAGYEQGVAAVLPCYWMYADIGHRLGAVAAGNPYREWIDTYRDPLFAESARTARGIADRVAARAEPGAREGMWRAFETSARLEREFFAAGPRP